MKSLLIKNALLINEGKSREASVLVVGDTISTVYTDDSYTDIEEHVDEIIDASGKWLLPGVIDDQVHFREPGLTHKADINTESMAAVAGGVTSYMEMPNTKPPTTTREALEWKFSRAAQTSLANYSFYIGATNDNIDEVLKADYRRVCGIKVFMGSSTGNMLVDSPEALARIFAEAPTLIATHCEKEEIYREIRKRFICYLPSVDTQCRGLLCLFVRSGGIGASLQCTFAFASSFYGERIIAFERWTDRGKADYGRGVCASSVFR